MKSKKLAFVALLSGLTICASGLIACNDPNNTTHAHKFEKIENGSTFTMECDCGEINNNYMLQFIYAEDGSKAEEDIEVSWSSASGSTITAKTNSLGYVETNKLLEDSYTFTVNEDTLPVIDGVKYWFNSDKFNTQTKGVGITIPLIAVYEPNGETVISIGDGDNTCYYVSLDKTYVATINSINDSAWFILQNDGFGKYTVDATLAEGVDVQIERYYGSEYYVNPVPDSKIDVSTQNKMTYTVILSDGPQKSMFRVKAPNATSYPVQIPLSVSITYKAPDVSLTQETLVKPTFFETTPCEYVYYTSSDRGGNSGSTLEKQTTNSYAPVGIEKWQDVDGSTINDLTANQYENMSLRNDGYYYTSDNKLIFVKLDAPSIFLGLTLASYLSESNPASFAIYRITAYDEYGCCTLWDNYFGFVQAYASLANSDGLYPLTQEMHEYLKIVAKKEHRETSELLCTYPKQTHAWTVGDGSESAPYVLALSETTLGSYNLSIAEGGKTYVKVSGNMDITLTFNSNVRAKINNTTYSAEYLTVNGETIIAFETKDGASINFVLTVAKYDNPYYLEVGENEVYAMSGATLTYEFVVETSGSYDIGVSSLLINASYKIGESGEVITLDGTYTVELTQGQSLFFIITTDLESDTNFSIIIENTPEN